MNIRLITVSLGILLILIAGCDNTFLSGQDSELNGKIIQDEQLKSEILNAPTEITMDGVTYTAEVFAWRDFMPVVNPPVRLIALNKLVRVDQEPIPDHIDLVQQYLVHGDAIWVPDYSPEDRPNTIPYQKEKISRNGPEWETGTEVTVGIKVINAETGQSLILSVPGVTIEKTL